MNNIVVKFSILSAVLVLVLFKQCLCAGKRKPIMKFRRIYKENKKLDTLH